MKKRVVSLLLCLIMALSLIPTVAFAAEVNTPTTDADKTTNGAYVNNEWSAGGTGSVTTNDGLTLSKTATYLSENTYRIDLSVVTTQEVTTQDSPAAVALVIDTSGSMAWCSDYHKHSDDCYKDSERCGPITNKYDHWVLGFHKVDTSCRLMDGKDGFGLYPASCGTTQHTHDNATGGYWCGNRRLNKDTDSRIANAKAAATAFISSFKSTSADRYVAVIGFNSSVTSTTWYNVSEENECMQALAAINNLGANGGTDMAAGLSSANTLMSATPSGVEAANRHVILLSDGAPTYANGSGSGSSGSADINNKTSNTATTLKNTINPGKLHTICFSAEDEICYSTSNSNGPTVGDFLRDSIASSADNAHTAENATELNNTFTSIFSTITTGLTGDGWTVTDPMADKISVVPNSLPDGFVESSTKGTYTWTLTNAEKATDGGKTTYTYTTSYQVTIDPAGLDENKFYPTNGVTTLNYKDANDNERHANFPVPGVKVKLPPTEPETGTLIITKKIVGLPFANVPAKSFEYFANPAASNYANGTKLFTLTVTDTTNGITASSSAQLPVGKYSLTESPNASQEVTGYTLVTTISVDDSTPVKFNEGDYDDIEIKVGNTSNVVITDTYTPNTPGATTAKITINKKVDVTGNTQPTATTMPTFQFVAKVGNTEVGKLSLTPTKGTDGKWTASGVMDITIPAKLFGANSYVEVKVSEVKGTLTTWTYDTHPEMFYINKDGQRITLITAAATAAEVVPATDSIATFTFTNKYSYTYTPTPKPNPRPTPKPVPSAKTGDMGIALYALTSLLSLSGTALVIKKRKDEE